MSSWKEIARFADGFTDAVTAVAFSPDGNRLAAGSMRLRPPGKGAPFDRAVIHLWNAKDRWDELPPLEIDRNGSIEDIVFSPDGRRLAFAQAGQRAGIFDLDSRAEMVLTGPAASARRIEFTPNGKVLGLADRTEPILRLWDVVDKRQFTRWTFPGKEVGRFQFAPRGGLLAVAHDDSITLIDRKQELPDRIVPLEAAVRTLAFAPGGRNLAIALTRGDVLLVDGRTGEIRQKYPGHPQYPQVSSVAFSPDGTVLAIGSGQEGGGGLVRLWRGPRVSISGWGQPFNPDGDCAITPDGEILTIRVPPTPHDLSAEVGRINAPRVLQEVEGDFTAQVKVCGVLHPTAAASVPDRVAYQAGGLLLWSDNRNYIRLERAALQRDGAVQPLAAFEMRLRGELADAHPAVAPDQDIYLRLERRGNQFRAAFSTDGRQWTPLEPLQAPLPAKVRIGVAAVNAARQPLSLRYEEFRVQH